MYPPAPDMRRAETQQLTDGELFYIIQNGVRLTGMPAWGGSGGDVSAHDEEDSWKLVHPKLPKEIIKAKVVWCRSQGKANPGFLEAGVQFLDVPPIYIQELTHFLTTPGKPMVQEARFQTEGGGVR